MLSLLKIQTIRLTSLPTLCLLSALVLMSKSPAHAGEPILMMQSGWSDNLQSYQKALIELLLLETEAEYGKTELIVVRKKVTTKRSRKLIFETNQRLVSFTSDWAYAQSRGMLKAKRPFFKLMSGLRRCVTSPSFAANTQTPATLAGLKTLSIGSGSEWPDNRVYEHLGIKLTIASQLSHLYEMVKLNRFNCLPLGVLESSETQPVKGTAIISNFYIFYPLPVFINASDLATIKRMELGYDKSLASGSFEKLFEQHFSENMPNSLSAKHIILLDNPSIPSDENKRLKAAFLNQFILSAPQ